MMSKKPEVKNEQPEPDIVLKPEDPKAVFAEERERIEQRFSRVRNQPVQRHIMNKWIQLQRDHILGENAEEN